MIKQPHIHPVAAVAIGISALLGAVALAGCGLEEDPGAPANGEGDRQGAATGDAPTQARGWQAAMTEGLRPTPGWADPAEEQTWPRQIGREPADNQGEGGSSCRTPGSVEPLVSAHDAAKTARDLIAGPTLKVTPCRVSPPPLTPAPTDPTQMARPGPRG